MVPYQLTRALRFFLLLLTSALIPGGFPQLAQGQNPGRLKPSQTLPLSSFYDTPQPLPPGRPGELIRSEPADNYHLPYELSVFRILYYSRTANGEDVAVSGVVLVPDGKPLAGGWPVIAWAHDFMGTSRENAPSLMKNLAVGPVLAMYANLGYAVVATDYAGLGTRGNAVQNMHSNALDVIYAVAAARAAVPQIGSSWIAVGSGQGAMAAIGVAESDVRNAGFLGSIVGPGLAAAQGKAAAFGLNPGLRPAHAPLLVISGQADLAAENIVTRMCKLADRVLFLKYGDVDASGAMGESVADQISWIKARFAGYAAPSNCP